MTAIVLARSAPLPPEVVDDVQALAAANAGDVDTGQTPASWVIGALAERGHLDLGINALLADPTAQLDLTDLTGLVDAIAQEDVASAFSFWAHRMVLDYLARGRRTPALDAELADLRRGQRLGSTAMATGVKALAGIDALPVQAVVAADRLRLDGVIPWASNLTPDATVVVAAGLPDGGAIAVAVRVDAPGVTRRAATGLLALDATASGTLRLDGVVISRDAVLADDLRAFAATFRPTFLVLQSAFALGLARRSLLEAGRLQGRPDLDVLRPQVEVLADVLARHTESRERIARDPGAAPLADILRLRLDVVDLAVAATRLEATLTGGRGYASASPTARRLREAAFFPIQSPSEGHLRWELSSLASTA